MSKPKFTPGPWKYSFDADRLNFRHAILNQDSVEIAHAMPIDSEECQRANARLIAAAPALVLHLESLLTILNADYVRQHLIQLDHDYIAIAKADLRKATGGGK